MTHTPEPRPTLPSLLVYASQLACVAAKAFDIQLAFGAEGARFLRHYEAASETGFAQLPFGSQAQANDVDLLWVLAHREGEPMGLGLLEDEKVFEGLFPIIGAPRVMHAVWATEAKYQARLARDWPRLSSRQPPDWLVPLEASYPSV